MHRIHLFNLAFGGMFYLWQKPNALVDLHATAPLNQIAVAGAGPTNRQRISRTRVALSR